jgi:hypothetical protein
MPLPAEAGGKAAQRGNKSEDLPVSLFSSRLSGEKPERNYEPSPIFPKTEA